MTLYDCLHAIFIGGTNPKTFKKKGLDPKDTHVRGCTDPGFLFLFITFLAGIVYIALWSFDNGNAWRLIYGTDSWDNVCGEDNTGRNSHLIKTNNAGLNMLDRPHQYYTDPGSRKAMILCVKSCPTSQSDYKKSCIVTTKPSDASNFTAISANGTDVWVDDYCVKYCLADPYSNDEKTNAYDAKNHGCPEYVYETYASGALQRCIPKTGGFIEDMAGDVLAEFVDQINLEDYFTAVFETFAAARWIIFWCLCIALGGSYLMVMIMRCFVRPLIFTLIVAGQLALVALTVFLWTNYQQYEEDLAGTQANQTLDSDDRNMKFFQYSAYTMTAVTSIVFIVLVALRNDIWIGATVYMEAAKALRQMPSMLISPFIVWTLLLSWGAFWLWALLFMASTDETEHYIGAGAIGGENHVFYREKEEYEKFWWYHLFGLFWVYSFLLAMHEFTLAGCVTEWYKLSGKNPGWMILITSYLRLFKHHIGSVALGSLIIAICEMIIAILTYIENKTKDSSGGLVKVILCACKCCFCCLERCLKFINRNAYIEINLYGYAFCNAAFAAFHAIMGNILKMFALNMVGAIVFFVIKLLVTAGVTIIAYFWMKGEHEKNDSLPYYGFVLVCIAIAAWFIAACFTSLFEMTADTILLCFCEDQEINNGKDKPYLAPDGLAKILGAHKIDKKKPLTEKERDAMMH